MQTLTALAFVIAAAIPAPQAVNGCHGDSPECTTPPPAARVCHGDNPECTTPPPDAVCHGDDPRCTDPE